MSSNPPLCPSPNGDSSSQTTTEGAPAVSAAIGDAGLAAKVDEAIVDDLVDEVDEVLEAESKPEVDDLVDADGPGINADAAPETETGPEVDGLIDVSRRRELMHGLFHQVRFELCDAFADPRCNITRFTMDAFTQVLPKLPADVSNTEAYEKLMDVAVQLAADDRPRFENLRGISEIQFLSLQVLYGFKFTKGHDEFRAWLAAVDDLPEKEGAVFQMIAFYGWKNADTASVLNISEGQASKLMARAKKQLTAATGVPVEELRESFFDVEIARRNQKQ
ncbi:sigma-70 family RNA polymerase sigma factor [Streptomyces sp. NPDC097610]|uniref:sigma-70 family RNA polymerase sigma factor n=1 Tax=Streptomyces sp. NPDC097610 TaxID=3157227 RepID=UPI00332FC8AA